MKDFVLLIVVLLAFIYGYFLMEKLDKFLKENQSQKLISDSKLRIGFETPAIIDSIADLLEQFSSEYPDYELNLFYGSVSEIINGLENNKLDFGFIIENSNDILKDEYCSLSLQIKQNVITPGSIDIAVHPINTIEKPVRVIWKNDINCMKGVFVEKLHDFSKRFLFSATCPNGKKKKKRWYNFLYIVFVQEGDRMGESRQNPEQLLKSIQTDEENRNKGHLKIFFGYAAGVGKTYAMLEAAHMAKQQGIDVVAGYVEPHACPKTAALLNGLEVLPTREVFYNGMILDEFDIGMALKRKPQLILVDELAHTNAEGCRHAKRYQDIKELLNAGIDVYTTVNVQHIESLCDTVASITEIVVRERIPDSIFDNADQVELIDIEPQDLINRLNTGNVYRQTQTKQAVENFFTIENLTALREISLRRCADRVNILTENTRIKNHGDYHTGEHILVCLSSSPSNAKIIRTAARMATALKGNFTALFVETPDFSVMSEENVKRLRSNIRLAEQLGAKIETVYGEDVPFQIAEFTRLSGVSKIVIGRSSATKRHLFSKPTLTEKLIDYAPNLDVHIIPDTVSNAAVYQSRGGRKKNHIVFSVTDTLKSTAILILSSLVGMIFQKFGFDEANIITAFVLGVLVTAVITKHQIYSLIFSIVSVLVFNFLFTEPQFTLQAYDQGYPVTFIIMLLLAFLTGSLAIRIKNQAKQAAQSAYRTKVLFDTNQLLQQAKDKNEIVSATSNQLIKLLRKDIVFYLADGEVLDTPHIFSVTEENLESCISENEKAVAGWVLKNNKRAGATTGTLSNAKCLYLAVRSSSMVYGVIGIVMGEIPLDPFENSILLSILGECALALENEKNAREKQEAAILAKNEQLRANLLRAISHDLRTPLTSISGNASNLFVQRRFL